MTENDGEKAGLELAKIEAESAPRMPYDQRPDENDLWYSRFWHWLIIGPTRSIRQAYIAECQAAGHEAKRTPPSVWYRQRQRYEWDKRAAVYDEEQRQLRRADEEQLRVANREARRAELTNALTEWRAMFDRAKDDNARRLLLDTLIRLTAEARREHGDDVQRVQELSAQSVTVTLPGVDDA